jgi:hypothetical protein
MFRRCAAEARITSDRRSHYGASKKAFDAGDTNIILGGRPSDSLDVALRIYFIGPRQ